jgi:hypothetical protein
MLCVHPFRYHAFLSYTTRTEEIAAVMPVVDATREYLNARGITTAPLFLDRFEWGGRIPNNNLTDSLWSALSQSVCLIALISPGYLSSEWCRFEWDTMSGFSADRRVQHSPSTLRRLYMPEFANWLRYPNSRSALRLLKPVYWRVAAEDARWECDGSGNDPYDENAEASFLSERPGNAICDYRTNVMFGVAEFIQWRCEFLPELYDFRFGRKRWAHIIRSYW